MVDGWLAGWLERDIVRVFGKGGGVGWLVACLLEECHIPPIADYFTYELRN